MPSEDGLFGFGAAEHRRVASDVLVSVIMTTFNAAATVRQAIDSVRNQTHQNFELIVVDDGSQDQTRALLSLIASQDERIHVICNDSNIGTYCSKNKAIDVAKGSFITFHDSDDWMHPQRLQKHIATMSSEIKVSSSNWLRLSRNGMAAVRLGGYSHRNPASMFMRREVFDQIGYFDSVRTGADTEMWLRIFHTYGKGAVKEMKLVLGLGLNHDESLTTSGVAAYDEFRYSEVRLDYSENLARWHFNCIDNATPLYMARPQSHRPFPAPEEISVCETN